MGGAGGARGMSGRWVALDVASRALALSCRGRGAGADCGLLRGVGITTGWGETEVFMEVSSRRLAIVQHRHPPARGLLSLISLLSAFSLTGINWNQLLPPSYIARHRHLTWHLGRHRARVCVCGGTGAQVAVAGPLAL